jgi:uncharacterized protein (TIGR02611 family)
MVAGMALVALGLAMLVLPGPGLLTMVAGLTLLAREFRWADQALQGLKRMFQAVKAWVLVSSQRFYKLVP